MGLACCTETQDLEPGQCGQGKHISKNTVMKCSNENCCTGPTVCEKCGCPSKDDAKKLLCKICACDGNTSDCDDGEDSLAN